MGDPFDKAYFDRFYRDPKTRVSDREATLRLARFIVSYLEYLEVPITEVLDMGCGLGRWKAALLQLLPDAQYRGVEASSYCAERFGWEQASIVDYAGPGADLVICQGVLQYLTQTEAEAALGNLARLSKSALYLEALTETDWAHNADQSRTDSKVHLRSGAWYRKQLAPHFKSAGGGLFLKHNQGIALFELEGCSA